MSDWDGYGEIILTQLEQAETVVIARGFAKPK
jgi:hypothetical protein